MQQHQQQQQRDVFAAPRPASAAATHSSNSIASLQQKKLPSLPSSSSSISSFRSVPLASKGTNTLPPPRRQLLPSSSKSIKESLWKSSSVQPGQPPARASLLPGASHAHSFPPQQQTGGAASLAPANYSKGTVTQPFEGMKRSASVAGLRSPPKLQSAKSVVLDTIDDRNENEDVRPAKRAYIGGQSDASLDNDPSTRPKVPLKARRSLAFPTSTASTNLAASTGSSTGLFPRRASLAPPSFPSSASLVSLSPSKFGLTVPREFTFTAPPGQSSKASLASSGSLTASQTSRQGHSLLAPSPIASDEHVPKPTLPLPRSRTLSSSLSSQAVRAPRPSTHLTSVDRPTSTIPASPSQSRQLELKGHPSGKDVKPFFSPIKEEATNKPRKSISPAQKEDMLRSDLMWRTLEKANGSPTSAPRGGVPARSSSPVKQALLSWGSEATSITGGGKLAHTSTSQPGQEDRQRPLRFSLHAPPRTSPSAAMQPSSPLKRSRSPIANQQGQAMQQEAGPAKRRVSSGMKRSTSMGAMARSMSTRSVTRRAASAAVQANNAANSVNGPNRLKVSRTASAPMQDEDMQVEVLRDGQDPSSAPASPKSSTAATSSKTASPDHSTEQSASLGDSTMLEMDTSIMSAAGQESLSNLDSLLSKMSLPRRRSSAAFGRKKSFAGTMHLLDERAEMEQELLAEPPVQRPLPGPRRVPGYLASTASSSAKRSSGPEEEINQPGQLRRSTGPVSLGRPTIGAPGMRRSSTGLPAARRGSLLPLASSSNAAQTALRTPTTLSGSPPKVAGDGAPNVIIEGVSGESSLQIEATSSAGQRQSMALKDVVAYVDVKTAEGDEAGGVFMDILRSLGARILTRPTDNTTHIIFKGGRPATLHRYRAYEQQRRPHLVGVGWIVRCREKNEKVAENAFLINPNTIDGVLLSSTSSMASKGNRRKTLEPKMLLAPPAQPQYGIAKHIFGAAKDPNSCNELDRARRRSMQFAPRIGSPLKQRVFNAFEADEEGIEAD